MTETEYRLEAVQYFADVAVGRSYASDIRKSATPSAFTDALERGAILLADGIRQGKSVDALKSLIDRGVDDAVKAAHRDGKMERYQEQAVKNAGRAYVEPEADAWPQMDPALKDWVEQRRYLATEPVVPTGDDDSDPDDDDVVPGHAKSLDAVVRDAGGRLIETDQVEGVRVYRFKSGTEVAVDGDGDFVIKSEDGLISGNGIEDFNQWQQREREGIAS